MNHQLQTLAIANNTIASTFKFINERFGIDKPIFASIYTPINVEMFRKAQEEAKKSDGSAGHEPPTTMVRNLVVDANNRIIGATDINSKMRYLWPTTSAFMPRREEIDNDVFNERLSSAEFMIRTVKEFVVVLFRKMKVDEVFSGKVIREKLDFDNQIFVLAHFDLEEDLSIEKTIVLVLQSAAYAHAVEKNLNDNDIRNLANELNPDILTIADLIFIDDKVRFDAAAGIIKQAIEDVSKEMGQEATDNAIATGLSEIVAGMASKATKEQGNSPMRDALLNAVARRTSKDGSKK